MTIFQTIAGWCKKQDWKADLEAVTQRLVEAEQTINALSQTIQVLQNTVQTIEQTFGATILKESDATRQKLQQTFEEVSSTNLKATNAIHEALEAVTESVDDHSAQLEVHRMRLDDTDKKVHRLKIAIVPSGQQSVENKEC